MIDTDNRLKRIKEKAVNMELMLYTLMNELYIKKTNLKILEDLVLIIFKKYYYILLNNIIVNFNLVNS